jgi:DNA repair protein SbcC/Rad50
MLRSLRIKNFQSVPDTEIELGKFTVLVGPSNSGKSAVLRAFRTIVSNVNGSAFVRHGAKKTELELHTDEGYSIFLERGRSLSTYRVITDVGAEEVYAKSGTTVPEDIVELLRISEIEGERLQFAFQFDRPFLMDAPGSKIASVIGDLTNINILHEAVREANRRRLEVKSRLKVRKADLEVEEQKLKAYVDISAVRGKLEEATEAHSRAFNLSTKVELLRLCVETVQAAEDAVVRLKLQLKQQAFSQLPVVDVLGLQERARKVEILRSLVYTITTQAEIRKDAMAEVDQLTTAIEQCHDDQHQMLRKAGICPMCKQLTGSI